MLTYHTFYDEGGVVYLDSDKKKLVSSEVLVKFFLKKLFEENLIDADTYVYAMNTVKDECKEYHS